MSDKMEKHGRAVEPQPSEAVSEFDQGFVSVAKEGLEFPPPHGDREEFGEQVMLTVELLSELLNKLVCFQSGALLETKTP